MALELITALQLGDTCQSTQLNRKVAKENLLHLEMEWGKKQQQNKHKKQINLFDSGTAVHTVCTLAQTLVW